MSLSPPKPSGQAIGWRAHTASALILPPPPKAEIYAIAGLSRLRQGGRPGYRARLVRRIDHLAMRLTPALLREQRADAKDSHRFALATGLAHRRYGRLWEQIAVLERRQHAPSSHLCKRCNMRTQDCARQ